jgi:hypothetical protein
LADDNSEKQIEKTLAGEINATSNQYVYSTDSAKLLNIAETEGWASEETTETTELEYVPDAEFTETVTNTPDANQPMYNALEDDRFRKSLTEKEVGLLMAMSAKEKFVAGFNKGETKLFESIKKKFGKYESVDENGQEPLTKFRKKDALAKVEEEAIEAIPEFPLSEEEIALKLELEHTIDLSIGEVEEATQKIEKSGLEMMKALAEIKEKRLHREEGSFADYAIKRFPTITTKGYAHNLAQYGKFLGVLQDVSTIADSKLNTRAVRALTEGANKVANELGLGQSEFAALRPIIESSAEIITELCTDEQGNVKYNPQIIAQAQKTIAEVAKTSTVTINGKQMSVEKAKAQGLLSEAVQDEVLETVVEQIKSRKAYIADEMAKAKERRFAPQPAVEPKTPKRKQFVGVVPTYSISCDNPNHKEANKKNGNRVVAVFNAGFELACGCKFQKLTISGDEFVCVESDGLEVQY